MVEPMFIANANSIYLAAPVRLVVMSSLRRSLIPDIKKLKYVGAIPDLSFGSVTDSCAA